MKTYPLSTSQRGIALVISLLFLVLITLIALSGMRGTILQERIAGNVRDRQLAFQAAEAALNAGASTLTAATLPSSGTGIYMVPGSLPDIVNMTSSQFWVTSTNGFDWSNSVQMPANSIYGLSDALQPRYVVERLTTSAPTNGNQIHDISFGPSHGNGFFRITARGQGPTGNSVVVLQETYIRQ